MATFVMLKRRMLLMLAVGVLFVGGVAYASIPDAGGVIHGCYRTSNPAKGALVVIDSATETCPSGTVALNWNQTGPQGPTGATGPQGEPGEQRYYTVAPNQSQPISIAANDNAVITPTCDTGDVAISGQWVYADSQTALVIYVNQTGGGATWVLGVKNTDGVAHGVVVYATCADLSPYRS